jgi:hypothetical protein
MIPYKFQVGDLVYMQPDKYEEIVFGVVTDRFQNLLYGQYLNEYGVKWFDDKNTVESEDLITGV